MLYNAIVTIYFVFTYINVLLTTANLDAKGTIKCM